MSTSPATDLTSPQATDLARYFLDQQWRAYRWGDRFALDGDPPNSFPPVHLHIARSWRLAFRAAGVKLPTRPQYANTANRVMLNGEAIATCASNNLARRITLLLNRHAPPGQDQAASAAD